MSSKRFQILCFNKNIITNIIFIIKIIIPLIQSFEFKYPLALTLENKNIFVLHSLGIDICDSSYTTSTKIVEFEYELSKSDLNKISICKYSSGEIILLIVNTIYVFNINGQKIISCNLDENFNADYFTLVPHKIINENDINYYYFVLGYINPSSLKLNLYYYKLDSISQSINCESALINYDNSIRYTGLSCEFILYESDEYIFCIYETRRTILLFGWDNDMYFDFFKINQNSITSSDKREHDHLELHYYRSSSKSIDSNPFYCGVTEDGLSKCLIGNFNFTEKDNIYDDDNEEKCINAPYNVKTYYFPDTDEYVFSCLTKNYKIQTTIYNKSINYYIENPSMRLLRSCEGCNSEFYYSIIYNKVKRKYYIISDMDCGIYGNFFPLIESDTDDDDEEEKKENERENIIEKEKEEAKNKENEDNKSKQEEESEPENYEKKISEKESQKEKEKEKEKEKDSEKEKKEIENEKEIEKIKKETEKEDNNNKENEKLIFINNTTDLSENYPNISEPSEIKKNTSESSENICLGFEKFEPNEYNNCNDINNIMKKICELNFTINISEEDLIKQENICLKIIEIGFTSKMYNTLDLDNGKETIIGNNKMNITLTTS